MYVHTFGAYFGMAATYWFWQQKKTKEKKDSSNMLSSHESKILSMCGTLFLWMYWPSFNGALSEGIT